MKQLLVAVFLFVAFIGRASAVEGWTGEIKWINVDEQGAAYIFIDNPRDGPKPAMTCGQYDIVYLGTKNQPANPALLSQALMIYSTGKTIRFAVRGTGDSCEAPYLSAR